MPGSILFFSHALLLVDLDATGKGNRFYEYKSLDYLVGCSQFQHILFQPIRSPFGNFRISLGILCICHTRWHFSVSNSVPVVPSSTISDFMLEPLSCWDPAPLTTDFLFALRLQAAVDYLMPTSSPSLPPLLDTPSLIGPSKPSPNLVSQQPATYDEDNRHANFP